MTITFHDQYKHEMMKVTKLKRVDDDLVMVGKLMGTMDATIYLKPAELIEMLKMLNWKVVLWVPCELVLGAFRLLFRMKF